MPHPLHYIAYHIARHIAGEQSSQAICVVIWLPVRQSPETDWWAKMRGIHWNHVLTKVCPGRKVPCWEVHKDLICHYSALFEPGYQKRYSAGRLDWRFLSW